MDLFAKIQRDVSEGISIVRKEGTSLFLKTMTEMDMLKYRFDVHKIQSRLSELYRDLGERFVEALEKKDEDVFSRTEVRDLIEKIENIRIEEERYKKEMDDLREMQSGPGKK